MAKEYHRRLFPGDLVHDLLTLHGCPLQHREIAVLYQSDSTLKTDPPNMRHLSCDNTESFLALVRSAPANSLHVGGVYDRPADEDGAQCVGRELTIDFDDMPVCPDCKHKRICEKTWAYEMMPRLQWARRVLRNEYGAEGFVACFSGGRSGHLLCLDAKLFHAGQGIRQQLYDQMRACSEQYMIDRTPFERVNGLIRMPFSVHPRTQRLDLPVDLDNPGGGAPFVDVNDLVKGTSNAVERFNQARQLLLRVST